MSEIATDTGSESPDALYDAEYYHSHCGDEAYTADSAVFLAFYATVAEEIVRSLTPRRVFDAGCAVGFLVAALWDRNVEAHGRDISTYAISQVRADVRDHCAVGSIADPIEGEFDLVLCIEVLEHMPEQEAIAAIAVMTRAAPRILFSSTPSDFGEPTHVNVRPTLYWLRQFAAAGFAPVVQYDASYLCPHAMLLERTSEAADRELVAFAEVIRQRLVRAEEARNLRDTQKQVSDLHELIASEHAARVAAETEMQRALENAEAQARHYAALAATPLRVEQLGRRVARVGWWAVSMQLQDRLRARRARLSPPGDALEGPPPSVEMPPDAGKDAALAVSDRFSYNRPLPTYALPVTERRLSVVTETIDEGYLYGGVGTAMVIATLLAERTNSKLRLITRRHPADVQRLQVVLEAQGLAWPGEIEVIFAPESGVEDIPMGGADVFLTTSWWTTKATLRSVPARQVIYLLQEDERMFYARGDDRLRCTEVLERTDLRMLVNSELLYDHLAAGPEPLPDFAARAHWFEPAFPTRLFHDDRAQKQKRRLLFYARPNNLRNLYWRGLEAIVAAMESGVLDPEQWTFTFVGRDVGRVVLPGGVVPEVLQNLPWDRYAELVRGIDLGLALMDTPHPSYPPLDMAASGAVVVTNSCGNKVTLDRYSRNIIVVPPGVDDLRDGLSQAVALLADDPARRRNYAQSGIQRDWRATLEGSLQRCTSWIEG